MLVMNIYFLNSVIYSYTSKGSSIRRNTDMKCLPLFLTTFFPSFKNGSQYYIENK